MISNEPVHGSTERVLALGVSGHLKVPEASRRPNHELHTLDDECVDPQKREGMVSDDTARLVIILHIGDEWKIGTSGRFTH